MCFIFSLIRAMVWLVIGFFVLFASTKVDGNLWTFGRILPLWTFVIAVVFPADGAYVTLDGVCPVADMMEQMHALASR